jgi:DNA helicase-2/ATP-dependent DNA helicase PcrA
MGVSAVPGSGKTHTLSLLAANLVNSGVLEDDQEVLVVTLVNSAVENFESRVGELIGQRSLLQNYSYRVRTLHGLGHDIVRERPALVGLEDGFQIVDEREAEGIIEDAALTWLSNHPYGLDQYLETELDEGRRDWIRRDRLPDLLRDLAGAVMRYAKDRQITAPMLRQRLDSLPIPLPLAEIGWAIYADYQRALAYRGAVDFDDLIRLALQARETDPAYLRRLQNRWPYILEDEAQDSSRLQEQILRLLTGANGNWVRVGDSNQAIYETFTTASPEYLRNFMEEPGVQRKELPDSGRSARPIIDLANYLIGWTQAEHPLEMARGALTPPYIRPVPQGDQQSNPPASKVHFHMRGLTPQDEIQLVADSLVNWLPGHPDETVAVLVPRNQHGFELIAELRRRRIEPIELLRSTTSTRLAAGALGNVINYLSDPESAIKLATAYQVWRRGDRQEADLAPRIARTAELLRKCRQVEDYLWPQQGRDWLASLGLTAEQIDIEEELVAFRVLVQRWQAAAILPIDQLLLTVSQDLFIEPADLAIAHKLATVLRRASQSHLEWRLPELTQELAVVARNERRFLGFTQEDTGFDPDHYKGKVVVATIHKAKGLEWDRVYLMSANNYDFPSGEQGERYLSEAWFLRDGLNLQAEALNQVYVAFSNDEYSWYDEGMPSQQARLDYVSERLRLLYVGITRARRDLIVTWNVGRMGELKPALPLRALEAFWRENLAKEAGSLAQEAGEDVE